MLASHLELAAFYALHLEGADPPETLAGYAALADKYGRDTLAPARQLLSKWRTNVRKLDPADHRGQVVYCLNALRRVVMPADRQLLLKFARQAFAQRWSNSQLDQFDQLGEVFADGYDFFLSFTGRNPTNGHAILRVNREYDAFIASVLTYDRRINADSASDNLLAGALHAVLRSDHRLLGFFYPDRKGDSTEVRQKLEDACRRSLALVQLLDNEMLLPQDSDVENYCYWEFKLAEQRGMEILFLFPYDEREQLLPLEERADEVADWYDRVSKADLRVLPLARHSDPKRLAALQDQVELLAEQLRSVRRSRLALIPA